MSQPVASLPSPVLMKLAFEHEELGLALEIISKPKDVGDSRICNVTKAAAAGHVWLHGAAIPQSQSRQNFMTELARDANLRMS